MNKFTKIAVMVATCLAAGYFSSLATQSSVETWYPTIEKPVFNPPSWVFAPVWSLLYVLMGVAAGIIWSRLGKKKHVRKGLLFFGIQLALNILWSILFFHFQNPFLALIEIILLWLMIYETIAVFKKANDYAYYLMIPYLLWVTYAAVLNGSIWWLNQ